MLCMLVFCLRLSFALFVFSLKKKLSWRQDTFLVSFSGECGCSGCYAHGERSHPVP